MSEKEPRMCAVALVDALGFKTVLERHTASEISAAWFRIRSEIEGMKKYLQVQHFGDIDIHSAWFSDTVAIVAQSPSRLTAAEQSDVRHQADLVQAVAMCVGYGIREGSGLSVPIAFRGAIAVGRAYVDHESNLFLGAPFVEAAALYEEPEGAFVILSPSADRIPKVTSWREDPLVEYEVPLKGGRRFLTRVVSPFVDMAASYQTQTEVLGGIARAMTSDRLDVAIKRANTERFVRYVVATQRPPSRVRAER
jgi:hypothetical protein